MSPDYFVGLVLGCLAGFVFACLCFVLAMLQGLAEPDEPDLRAAVRKVRAAQSQPGPNLIEFDARERKAWEEA